MFRAVDAYADATGGRAKLTGEIRLNLPGMPFTGTLDAERFILHRSPMIAKIAAMGPVSGIIDALAADGLPFSQLSVTFTQRAGVITVAEGIAAGPGVALTVRGSVDRARDELSLEGTLVPNHEVLAKLAPSPSEVTAFSDLGPSARARLLRERVAGRPLRVSQPVHVDIAEHAARAAPLTTGGPTTRRRGRDEADEALMEPEPAGRSRRRRRGALPAEPAAGGRRKAAQPGFEAPKAGKPPKPGTPPKAGTAPQPGTPPGRGGVPQGTAPRPRRAPAKPAPAAAAPGVG